MFQLDICQPIDKKREQSIVLWKWLCSIQQEEWVGGYSIVKERSVQGKLIKPTASSCISHIRSYVASQVRKDYLNQMKNAVLDMSIDNKVDISKYSCSICCEGKPWRLSFKSTNDIVHRYIWGPTDTRWLEVFLVFLVLNFRNLQKLSSCLGMPSVFFNFPSVLQLPP